MYQQLIRKYFLNNVSFVDSLENVKKFKSIVYFAQLFFFILQTKNIV